mmetsp:Transcript_9173/g.29750  ORF Transcript_9173/g.29750 Transcript_9173/m.29750 type:complete len:205 (-) Transcript_9173:89-703(-)
MASRSHLTLRTLEEPPPFFFGDGLDAGGGSLEPKVVADEDVGAGAEGGCLRAGGGDEGAEVGVAGVSGAEGALEDVDLRGAGEELWGRGPRGAEGREEFVRIEPPVQTDRGRDPVRGDDVGPAAGEGEEDFQRARGARRREDEVRRLGRPRRRELRPQFPVDEPRPERALSPGRRQGLQHAFRRFVHAARRQLHVPAVPERRQR